MRREKSELQELKEEQMENANAQNSNESED